MSVNLCVCLSANSSKTANPIELKFCGMIPFGVQMDLGKTISGLDQPFAKNSKKKRKHLQWTHLKPTAPSILSKMNVTRSTQLNLTQLKQ